MSELDTLCRQVWGAYQYLFNHDLAEQSGTSKRLRAGQPDKLKARLLEELAELRGVVEGTHFHEGFDQDIILEGYEVWYWAVCLAVALELEYDRIDPAWNFNNGYNRPNLSRSSVVEMFDELIKLVEQAEGPRLISVILPEVFVNIGAACSLNNTDPLRLIERDRAEMSQKSYLQPYWENLTAPVRE